ncbi:hypothetical protein Hanom_Chr05g00454261 [Helianthus anomalus]
MQNSILQCSNNHNSKKLISKLLFLGHGLLYMSIKKQKANHLAWSYTFLIMYRI